jgi:dTDP-4-dehydrorhamnose reductase
LILGAYGRLGSILQSKINRSKYEIFLQGRKKAAQWSFDPTDEKALYSALSEIKPDNIINLVALTNLKLCEQNPKLAFSVNAQIAINIQKFLSEKQHNSTETFFLQISTDHIYSSPFPNTEEQAKPLNMYGRTKILGETAALQCGGSVLRTNYIGASSNPEQPSLTDWIMKSLQTKTPINGFDDVYINALHSSTLCSLINHVLCKKHAGLFNVGTISFYSKSDIIRYLAKELNFDIRHVNFGSANFSDNVERPLNMSMDVSKFETTFRIDLPAHITELEKLSQDYHPKGK